MKRNSLRSIALAAFWLAAAAVFAAGQPDKAAAGAAALKGPVSFYTIAEWTGIDALKPDFARLETEFEAEHPGVDAKVLSDPFMTWLDKYQIMLAAGTSPDVVLVGMADFPKLANAGYLMDLGPYFDDKYFGDFVPGILKNYVWNGKHYALPYTMDTRVLYYNKDLFRKAGLDPDKPPKTWAEYLDYAKKLTMDTNGDGKIDTYGNAYSLPIPEFVHSSLFLASGSDVITIDAKGVISANVDTPEFRDYLQLMLDLKKYSPPDFITLEGGGDDQLFVNGKLGMRINGSWMLDQNPAVKTAAWLGQALIPKRKAADAGGSYGAGFGLAIPAKAKNPELAVAFLRKIMTPQFHGALITNPPPKYENLAASAWSKDPIHTVELEQFKTTRAAFPNNLYFDKLNRAEQEIVTKVLLETLTVDQAVKELAQTIAKIVAQ
jgi:ABC-type glycerol-3-phosphate transport system substrate-binding protein